MTAVASSRQRMHRNLKRASQEEFGTDKTQIQRGGNANSLQP